MATTSVAIDKDKVEKVVKQALQDGPLWCRAVWKEVVGKKTRGCVRCAFRFIGVRDKEFYAVPISTIIEALQSQTPSLLDDPMEGSKAWPPGVCCPLCLGALQTPWEAPLTHGVIQEVQSKLQIEDYQVEGSAVKLALSVTGATTLRDAACWSALKESGVYGDSTGQLPASVVVDMKEMLRPLLERDLCRALGLKADKDGDLHLTVALVHEEADRSDFSGVLQAVLPSDRRSQQHQRHGRKRRRGGDGRGQEGSGGNGNQALPNENNFCNSTAVGGVLKLLEDDKAEASPTLHALSNWFNRLGPLGQPGRWVVVINRAPIFLEARYQKFSRKMPQTAWWIDGVRMAESSVEEVVAGPVKEFCRGDAMVFIGGGREDMDVRMLGSGRPFVLQVNNARRVPRIPAQVSFLQDQVNAPTGLNSGRDVAISGLTLTDKSRVAAMQAAAEDKEKFYTCIVWLSRPTTAQQLRAALDSQVDLVINQKTPVRVLHRRTLMTRPKVIHEMHTDFINQRFFCLNLRTSAGTYIKEFVHGDLGRTSPSVGSLLGCQADILQLDVTDLLIKDHK